MRRIVMTLIVVVLGIAGTGASALPALAASPETLTIGTTSGTPSLDCGSHVCAAVQAEGPSATVVPASGRITTLRVRHGRIDGGGLLPTTGTLRVLQRNGSTYTVKSSTTVTFAATGALDSLSTFPVSMNAAAGDYVGLEISGAYAQSRPVFLAEGADDDVADTRASTHGTGNATYTAQNGVRVLFSVDLTTGSDPVGPGVPVPGDPNGPRDPGTSADQYLKCPSSTRSAAGWSAPQRPDARAGGARAAARAKGWRRSVLGRQDRMMDVQLAYDKRGRAHVAARGAMYYGVHHYGPQGHRQLDATVDQNDGVGLTIGADGRPIVVWGERRPTTVGGRIVHCPRLQLAVPGGGRQLLRTLPAKTRSAFLHPEVARAGRHVHLAYDVKGRLVHQRLGAKPATLPVKGVRSIRIDAKGKKVLLGARGANGRLVVFQKVGNGKFRVVARARKVHDFDLALVDGKPVVVWAGGTVRRLTVLTQGRRITTRTPAEKVAVAARGKQTHIAFSTVARTTCGLFGCLRSGVYHVGLRGRRIIAPTTVVASGSTSPFRIAIDSHGRTVGVAMSRNGLTTLHQRRF